MSYVRQPRYTPPQNLVEAAEAFLSRLQRLKKIRSIKVFDTTLPRFFLDENSAYGPKIKSGPGPFLSPFIIE